MKKRRIFYYVIFFCLLTLSTQAQSHKEISRDELHNKIAGYWIGQLVGNYMGFPFENCYSEKPLPIMVTRYYNYFDTDSLDLLMNKNDRRAFIHIMADALGGAWSDDDTDIEFVTLHAVEKYGLDLTYEEITEMWKNHINRYIWSANRRARDLMEEGVLPPATGKKENNENWYKITSQLVNEIWSVFYPGMTQKAGDKALWGAKIMCDDWATHATQAYGIMYSAAFFENDVNKLVQIAAKNLPADSPYKEGILNVVKWHKENPDWQTTRQLIHNNYYDKVRDFEIPQCCRYASAMVNGLCGIMAILYGEGDFLKTISIATSAGYDCDNQAATCGGLMGIINGSKAIPDYLTMELSSRNKWDTPFNNQYINYSRDGLPNFNLISDIVDRIMAITEFAILENGGKSLVRNSTIFYSVSCDF